MLAALGLIPAEFLQGAPLAFEGVEGWLAGVAIAAATLVSEDLTCIAVGVLAAQGKIPFLGGTLACFLGIFVGDLLLFLAGRWFGRRALELAPFRRWLSPHKVERAAAWFQRRGAVVILLSRFLPGTRLPTYFAGGMLAVSLRRFLLWFTVAAALWTPLLVFLAGKIGEQVIGQALILQRNLVLGLAAGVGVVWLVVKVALPVSHYRGRRLLLSRWRRWTRFEFWPRWVVYAPIVPYALWLGLKHRCLTAFTAANPGIPASGFIGESKGRILQALDRVPATESIPQHLGLAAAMERAERFQQRHELGWPLVVKPDVGQRGDGVMVVRSTAELREALRSTRGDLLVQQHVGGVEYGLFYVRRPSDPAGWIFSVVEKVLPRVIGDGVHTLEHRILADERAVCMAPLFLDRFQAQLDTVPGHGEIVSLGELGTHCRGALFRDGSAVRTRALESALDGVARGFPGFHLGRFDVRAASREALAAGEFWILELNGVTSEPGHIYDPSASLGNAWRTLARQWSLAFEIGAQNAREGAPVTRVIDLLRSVWAYGKAPGRAVATSSPVA